MTKIKHLIISVITMALCFEKALQANASSRGKVELSDPVGSDILPGGRLLEPESIRDSFIFSKLMPFLIKYAIGLAAALAVIAIIYGGYQYMTAYGDEEKHKTAKKTIIYAVIGLVLAITAFGIVKIITAIKIT